MSDIAEYNRCGVSLSSSCWTQGPTWRGPRSATDRRARRTLRCSWPQQQVGKHTCTHTEYNIKHSWCSECCPTYSRSVFGSDSRKLNYYSLLNYTGGKSVEGSSGGRGEWIKAAVTKHLITALGIQSVNNKNKQCAGFFFTKEQDCVMNDTPAGGMRKWEGKRGRRSESSAAPPVVV